MRSFGRSWDHAAGPHEKIACAKPSSIYDRLKLASGQTDANDARTCSTGLVCAETCALQRQRRDGNRIVGPTCVVGRCALTSRSMLVPSGSPRNREGSLP